MKNLENIIEIAAQLVIDGKATTENAIEMALEIDTNRALKCVEDMADMNRGYINPHNKTQAAYNTMMQRVFQNI